MARFVSRGSEQSESSAEDGRQKERRALPGENVRRQRFTDALTIVSKADLPTSVRKGLLRRAAEVFIENGDGQARPETSEDESLGIVDAAVALARKAMGPCSLGEVIRGIRSSGQKDFARRLHKSSKARNLRAHPDPLLLRDLCRFFEGPGEAAGLLRREVPLQDEVKQREDIAHGHNVEIFDIATPLKIASAQTGALGLPVGTDTRHRVLCGAARHDEADAVPSTSCELTSTDAVEGASMSPPVHRLPRRPAWAEFESEDDEKPGADTTPTTEAADED